MTTPSTTNPPAAAVDTPTPNTATLAAIRAWKPEGGWWQFELRPWHYAVAIAAVFGCTAAVVLVVLTHAAAR